MRLIRLVVLLHHRRSDEPLPKLKLEVERELLRLQFPRSWLENHPLMQADLEQERGYCNDAKLSFEFS